jgi:hypothetical protein
MLNDEFIESLRVKPEAHPVYAAVTTLDDLRVLCTSIRWGTSCR